MLDKYDLTKVVSAKNDILATQYYTEPNMELTAKQKQLILFLVSRIEKGDTDLKTETITISDYCEFFNINYNGGTNRKTLRKSIGELYKKFFFLETAPNIETACRWLDSVVIDHGKGIMHIKLSDCLKPYYLNLQERFFAYQLGYTLHFKSHYSYVLYEFLKSRDHQKDGIIWVEVDYIKDFIAHNKYSKFSDFEKRVLKPAVAEINAQTDITVVYKAFRDTKGTGRKYRKMYFKITPKTDEEMKKIDTIADWKFNRKTAAEQTADEIEVFLDEQMVLPGFESSDDLECVDDEE